MGSYFYHTYLGTTKNTLHLHPELKITQSISITNRVLTCIASIGVDNVTLYHIDLRWGGKDLQLQSLWVKQENVTQQKGGHIARQLKLDPLLESNAGHYTCSLVIKDKYDSVLKINKTLLVKGKNNTYTN